MTVDARSDAVLGELLAVNILVAVLTLSWRGSEVCRDELGLQVGRLVAIDAGGGLVRSHQWERRLRVVEARELAPLLGGVASFAAHGRSVGASLLHAFGKLPFVRIFVAGRAGEILPVIEDNRFGRPLRVRLLLVAVATGNGNVSAGQNEVRLLVPG